MWRQDPRYAIAWCHLGLVLRSSRAACAQLARRRRAMGEAVGREPVADAPVLAHEIRRLAEEDAGHAAAYGLQDCRMCRMTCGLVASAMLFPFRRCCPHRPCGCCAWLSEQVNDSAKWHVLVHDGPDEALWVSEP